METPTGDVTDVRWKTWGHDGHRHGTDGSPESLRALQLEYGAEIGRAIVNFDGRIVFCVVSRYHGGAFVVLSQTVYDNTDGMSNHVADDRTVSEGRIEPVTIVDSRLGTCGGHPAYHAVQRTYPNTGHRPRAGSSTPAPPLLGRSCGATPRSRREARLPFGNRASRRRAITSCPRRPRR